MSISVTSFRHLCYAFVVIGSFATLQAQQATPPTLSPPPTATAPAGAETKPIRFRATGTGLTHEAPSAAVVTPASAPVPIAVSPSTTAVAVEAVPATSPLEAPAAGSLTERRESLEAEIRSSRSRMESNRRRAEVFQSLGRNEEADRMRADVRDLEARIRNSQEQLAQVEEELARSNPSSEVAMENGEEVILPGNNIELWVNEDTSFNGRYQVRRGGYVILPQIGRVQVAGKTIPQSEAAVRKALQATQLRRATVMIERFDGITDEPGPMIYLSGEFRNPRPYRIPQGTAPTLVSVILSAGGVKDDADLTRVKVMRMAANRSVVEEVNVKKILDGTSGGLGNDITLTEGDVVVVPSGSTNLVYVTGRVKKPGSYRVGENEKLTVYGAILQSGGFDNFANTGSVHVLRAMPDGTKAKLPVSIKDVQKGRRPDVVLQPNDIVVVPEKWFSW